MIITRRSMLFGILAAPLIVRAGSLMTVKPIDDLEAAYDPYHSEGWGINVPFVVPHGVMHIREKLILQNCKPSVFEYFILQERGMLS